MKLEEEVISLKSHIKKYMVECGKIEQYKEIENRAKQYLVKKTEKNQYIFRGKFICL